MAKTDANPPMMPYTDEYSLVEVDADYLTRAVKPKQFIHIDQTECIACEGCVDICPWKCIHMVQPEAVIEAEGTEQPGLDPSDAFMFIIDDDICTRCALCVDRCPTGVIILGKIGQPTAAGDSHARTNSHGYGYGMRLMAMQTSVHETPRGNETMRTNERQRASVQSRAACPVNAAIDGER